MTLLWRVAQVGAVMLHVSAARGQTDPAPEAGAATAITPAPATAAELPNAAPYPPPVSTPEPTPSQDPAVAVDEPTPASPAVAPPPAQANGEPQSIPHTPPTPAGAGNGSSTAIPASSFDMSKGEWGASRSTARRWHSRYGLSFPLNQSGSGTRFYTGRWRAGMWTNFEYRILPAEQEHGLYLGVALQVEYEFDKHSPYNSDVKTELMIWEGLLRLNAGYHIDLDNRGLLLYVHAGGGGQRLRGRAWSQGEPAIQAVQHALVKQAGVGCIFSFFHNRLELVLEGGVEKSTEITLQSGDRARAFLLPPLDPSSYYLRTGFGLGF